MKARIMAKLRSCAGESLAETLFALLISALALLMLAGAVSAGTRVILLSEDKLSEYYAKDAAMATTANSGRFVSVTLKESGASSAYETFDNLKYYHNDAFGGSSVVMYTTRGAAE